MKKILLFLSINILLSPILLANWLINRDKNVPYIRQNDYKDFGLSACAPTSTAMVLKYYFPNSYISNGQIYHAGVQAYYYTGPMKYYKNVSFQTCSASVSSTGICISDTGKNIIDTNGRQYFKGNYSGTVFSNIKSYLENNWKATVSTVTTDYNHIEEALRDTPLIANVHVCGSGGGHYLVIHNIDDSGTPNDTDDDYFIVNDPEPNCSIYKQKRNGKNKKIAVNTFLNRWLKGSIYKVTFPNNNQRILVEPSHSNIDGYTNGSLLEKYETYDYNSYTDKFDKTKTSFENVVHVMKIIDENMNDIMYYYGKGKSLIYLKKGSNNTAISTVLWKPKLEISGNYRIDYTTLDNGSKNTLKFEVLGSDGIVKKSTNIQYNNKNIFIKKTLFKSVKLEDGDYVRVKNVPQDVNLGSILFIKTNDTSITTYLSNTELKKGLYCTESVELAKGAFYCETSIINSDDEVDKFKLIIADRNRPYRIRPIVQVNGDATKSKKSGRFKNKSVFNHIKSRASSKIIGAINGDGFHTDSKIPLYKYSTPSFPSRTFVYGGVNINQSERPEPILSFSSKTDRIGIKVTFNNIGEVREGDNFLSTFYNGFYARDIAYKGTTTFIEQGGKFNNSKIAKSNKKDSYTNWSIGLTQGSILGGMYAPNNNEKHMYVDKSDSKNIQNDNTIYGTNDVPRLWYENTCYLPNDEPDKGGDYIPFISFNEEKIILGVSDTKIKKNKHICHFLRNLNMDYGAYLDGGGSTQLVIRNKDAFNKETGKLIEDKKDEVYLDKSPDNNDRKVLSAIALVENYTDISDLGEEYQRAIYYLTDFGIFSGHDDGSFGAGENISRAEFSKMIIRLLEVMKGGKIKEEGDLSKYTDIDEPDWFLPYAKKVVGLGLMEGNTEKTKLSPKENITYWEVAKVISIAFQGKNIKAPIEKNIKEKPKDGWYHKYLQCLNNYGTGYENRFSEKYSNLFDNKLKSYYDPNQQVYFSKYATREDVALFLYRAFILWQDGKFDDVSKSCVKK